MEKKKLTPSEVLENILDIHMHHTEYDDEDPDYPIQWDQDDGTIAENYPEEAKILREALQPKDSTYYLDLHNRALADEYESLKQAVRNVMSTEDMYCSDSLEYYIDKHENDEDFFEQLSKLTEAEKLIVFQEALHIFKRPWLKSILEEVKDSGKSPYNYRAREMYNYYYIYLPKDKK